MAAYTTIDDAGAFFNTILYTATGSSLAVTGAGFQPDVTWIKNRTATDPHILTDVVRGATKYLECNDLTAETTDAESLKSFDSDGFTVGTMASVNTNTEGYVAWNWKAGGTGALNEVGTSDSTVSVNTTSGVSIATYTGTGATATIGHGLGVVPELIFTKVFSTTEDWMVYVKSMGNDTGLRFNDDFAALATSSAYYSDTTPTSTVFTVGTHPSTNWSTKTLVAYCFAPIQGFSAMGSYEGNGNANGSFIFTGFRPAWIMVKRYDTTNNWILLNNKMSLYNNEEGNELYADNDQYQNPFTDGGFDFLSNGFKARGTNASLNASTGDYAYVAFADSPLVNSSGAPANAR